MAQRAIPPGISDRPEQLAEVVRATRAPAALVGFVAALVLSPDGQAGAVVSVRRQAVQTG